MTKLINITGKALSGEWGTDDELGCGIPILRTTNFTNEGVVNYSNVVTRTITKKNINEKFLRKGDIIIEKSGGSDKFPVGRVIYFDGDDNKYLFNNFTGLLRVKDQNEWYPKYVFYSLFANYKRGGTRAFENKTTGLHNLKIDDYVSTYEISNADLDEQKTICNKLDKLFGIIKSREKELRLLDDLIKARFVEMFGDCDNKTFIGDVISISRGASPRPISSFITDGLDGVNWIKIGDVSENSLYITNTEEKITPAGAKKSRMVHKGDFILSNSMSFGRPYILEIDGCVHDGWLIMSDFKETFNELYLYYAIRSEDVQYQFNGKVNGATVKNLNSELVKNTLIKVPPMNQQELFAKFVKQVDKSKFVVQKSLDEAQLLFDSLMQEYFG